MENNLSYGLIESSTPPPIDIYSSVFTYLMRFLFTALASMNQLRPPYALNKGIHLIQHNLFFIYLFCLEKVKSVSIVHQYSYSFSYFQ